MKTRKHINKKIRKTAKEPIETKNKRNAYIVQKFLEISNMVKLYHWKNHSYSQHKATDEIYERLKKHIDEFVEVLLGKENRRVKMIEKSLRILDNNTTKKFNHNIYEFREFLVNLENSCKKKDTGLLSIRDDLLININQFLYLMTLDK